MLTFIDGTRANLGASNSIKTWVILKNENSYFMGCPCHIIHNTAHKGLVGFTRVTKFDIEDLNQSTKGKNALPSYVEFCARISWCFETCKCMLAKFQKSPRKNFVGKVSLKSYFHSQGALKSTVEV